MKLIICIEVALTCSLACYSAASAEAPQAKDGLYFPAANGQTETDEYTRYELLAPETASFKIFYEVSATTPGARFFYNPIRKGSAASDESVYDAMLGTPLHFEVVSGAQARMDALMPDAELATNYIKVTLARPVPEHGENRVVIDKNEAQRSTELRYQKSADDEDESFAEALHAFVILALGQKNEVVLC